jgi:hypothetical protein
MEKVRRNKKLNRRKWRSRRINRKTTRQEFFGQDEQGLQDGQLKPGVIGVRGDSNISAKILEQMG